MTERDYKMKYIRTKYDKILDIDNTKECIYVIRDTSVKNTESRYVSYLWDNWKEYHLIDYQNCMLFSFDSAQNFIRKLMEANLKFQDLVIELSPYYKDCKQADTIEELCDEIVLYDNQLNTYGVFVKKVIGFKWLQNHIEIYKGMTIYGAIWTSKGLIYVAKMNDKGELELC